MAATKPRRVVDALDDIAREMRTANLLEALRLGTSALDDVDTTVIKADTTKQRQTRLNKIRAGIRQALDIEGDDRG